MVGKPNIETTHHLRVDNKIVWGVCGGGLDQEPIQHFLRFMCGSTIFFFLIRSIINVRTFFGLKPLNIFGNMMSKTISVFA